MTTTIEREEAQVGSHSLTFETGKIAKLADGAVVVGMGETVVLVTAVSQHSIREGQDFFPLSVEYKEKAAAAGQFPGGFFKREGRPTEKEILTCRMTDRPLRPLFPKGYLYDTQIIALLLSADGENDADVLAMNGASAALCVSDIPFAGPIGAVRVGRVDGEFIANPTHSERENSDVDLVYVGTRNEVIMIEGAADELPDEEFKKALEFAQASVVPLVEAQEELARKAGKAKREVELLTIDEGLSEAIREITGNRLDEALFLTDKTERGKALGELRKEVAEKLPERYPDATDFEVDSAYDALQMNRLRTVILEQGKRLDGRGADEIRQLTAEANVLPRVHGSALFSRGETQALAITTLAPADEAQYFDNYTGGEDTKRFLLHYNFPPFSVGETGRMGGLNRREIGHGALAERSIEPVIPDEAEFPYAIRVVSEIMESNGSTSMASVCSGSMALMAAGVPLRKPVAGISCGLVTQRENGKIAKYVSLVDIIGQEDFFGDMDFKLCGTSDGVTGYQLDLKLPGIPLSILFEAIDKTCDGRKKVLEVMNRAIDAAGQLSPHAPRIETVKIDPEKIGELIGPGGKNIKAIQAESGAEINIADDGRVSIYASKQEALERAKELVERVSKEIEVGETYFGKIVSTTNFGAFMEVFPGKDGMIHISELADFRVKTVEDVVKKGDMVWAKCIGIDDKGRVKLSRKEAMKERADAEEKGAAPAAE